MGNILGVFYAIACLFGILSFSFFFMKDTKVGAATEAGTVALVFFAATATFKYLFM